MQKEQQNIGNSNQFLIPLLIIGTLFFIFGFISWLNGILIPYLKISCELNSYQSLFVAFSFYISYTIMSVPSAFVLDKTGLKNGITFGLWIMSVGTMIFIPAAMVRKYEVFLLGLFITGTGLSLLQTAANPYITVIGPAESAARRISILGICNKFAGVLAPLILSFYIFNDADTFVSSLASLDESARGLALDQLAQRVIAPYIIISVVLFLLGIGIRFAPLPQIKIDKSKHELHHNHGENNVSILRYPALILGAITLFFYMGAEVIAADTIIIYAISAGIKLSVAKLFTTFTMAGMVAGYILGIVLIPRFINQNDALKYSAIAGVLLTIGVITTSGMTSVIFVACLGLANALVWPTMWPLAINKLGRHLNIGSAILVMAISGGAIFPLIWGKLSDNFNANSAYSMLIPIYLIILYYAIYGYKLEHWYQMLNLKKLKK